MKKMQIEMKYKFNFEKYRKSQFEEILFSGCFEILNRDLAVRESRPCQHVSWFWILLEEVGRVHAHCTVHTCTPMTPSSGTWSLLSQNDSIHPQEDFWYKAMWQCRWRDVKQCKWRPNASCATLVECHLGTQFNPSHGVNFWVRCASGNVLQSSSNF